MKKLDFEDAKNFLAQGELTQPFIEKEIILENINRILAKNDLKNTPLNRLVSLNDWMFECLHFTKNEELRRNSKFSRTAEEIWKSGKLTGCTDCAMVFASLVRSVEIPATILATASEKWADKFLSNDDYRMHNGHTFCECFIEDKWILTDPTFRKITPNYNADKIVLDYEIAGDNVFIPYFRGLDIEKRQTTQDYNLQMEKAIKKIANENLQPCFK